MAKYECIVSGDLDAFLSFVEDDIQRSSASASLEERSDRETDGVRMGVRVFERYSAGGGNRVSLTVAALAGENGIHVAAITSGGSQAVFFKVNTMGEESFLGKARNAFERWEASQHA
jgi:hypothetical protein